MSKLTKLVQIKEDKKNFFKSKILLKIRTSITKIKIRNLTNSKDLIKALHNCGNNIFGLAYCAGSINLKSLSLAHENDYIESFRVNTLGAVISIKAIKDILKKK